VRTVVYLLGTGVDHGGDRGSASNPGIFFVFPKLRVFDDLLRQSSFSLQMLHFSGIRSSHLRWPRGAGRGFSAHLLGGVQASADCSETTGGGTVDGYSFSKGLPRDL